MQKNNASRARVDNIMCTWDTTSKIHTWIWAFVLYVAVPQYNGSGKILFQNSNWKIINVDSIL